jgi:dTDP-4-amino-4,6-dideoxygalactose transaminase
MKIEPIPFNRPYATGKEPVSAAESQRLYHLSGDGQFTKRCQAWIEDQTGCAKALLTPSWLWGASASGEVATDRGSMFHASFQAQSTGEMR